jgi:hypothetical protein
MAVLDWTQRGGLTADVAAKLLPVLSIGIHDPTLGFTDAFFHTTAQRQQEVAEAAFADIRILGIEGRCVDYRRRARGRHACCPAGSLGTRRVGVRWTR